MIVFASTRAFRRRRRIPSVASFVRALGTVRVTDSPDAWRTTSAPTATHPPDGAADRTRTGRGPAAEDRGRTEQRD